MKIPQHGKYVAFCGWEILLFPHGRFPMGWSIRIMPIVTELRILGLYTCLPCCLVYDRANQFTPCNTCRVTTKYIYTCFADSMFTLIPSVTYFATTTT